MNRLNPDSQQRASISPASLKLMWAGVFSGLIILALLMYVNDYLGLVRIQPLTDIAPYLLWGGIGTLILPIVYMPRYRRDLEAFKQEWQTQQTSGETDMNTLARQQGRIMIAFTLADTPAIIGVAYYLLSADLSGGLLLVITSMILLLRYKPD